MTAKKPPSVVVLRKRLARLYGNLSHIGHRAYSIDNLESKSAVKAFERLEQTRREIKETEDTLYAQGAAPKAAKPKCSSCDDTGIATYPLRLCGDCDAGKEKKP